MEPMPEQPKPSDSRVLSLLDRLPASRRAVVALRGQLRDDVDLQRLGDLARQLEELDPAEQLAAIDRAPPDTPSLVETKMACCAMLGAQRFLRGDAEGAFATWAASIEEHPEAAAEVHIMRSQILSMRGDYDDALADLDRAVALRPTHAGGYARRGDCLRRLDREPEAIANYRRAAQLDHDDLSAAMGLGACLYGADELAEAASWFTQAIRIAPKLAEARASRALCLEELDRTEEALADLDVAVALDPDDPGAYHIRARCRPRDQHAEALADLARAIELEPGSAPLWAARARKHLVADALDEAIADATQALALDPTMHTTHFVRGVARQCGGDLAGARDDYAAAAKLDPMELTYRTSLVVVHEKLGDREGLRADLQRAVAIAPTHPGVRAEEARALAREGEHARALEHFDAAMALGGAPTEVEQAALHHQRADCLRALDRLAEAAEDEARAVELDPSKAIYWSWLGNYRSKIEGQEHLAEEALSRAVQIAPEDAVSWFNLALYHAGLERWEEAVADLDRTLALETRVGLIYFQRGKARWQASDEDEDTRAAILDYTRAVELGADEAEILTWRAEAYVCLDEHQAALADAERVLALDPDCGEAMHMRARCKKASGDAAGAQEDLERAAEMGWEDAIEELGSAGS
jgi:tetratricopeptide (TPR) repeat protein